MPIIVSETLSDESLFFFNQTAGDPQAWVTSAVTGKVASCKMQMMNKWLPILLDRGVAVTTEAELIAAIQAQPDYEPYVT